MAKASKSDRSKYGLSGGPIPCTRLMVRELEHVFVPGEVAHACLAINDVEGTFTAFNLYGPDDNRRTGSGFDAEGMTHDLPEAGSDKWKKWSKKGYEFTKDIEKFQVLKVIATKPKPAEPAATK